ncbi:MAG TPA: diguanylate cyclase [Gammaproteobacteria bacterium]
MRGFKTLALQKPRLAPGRVPIRFRLLLGFAVPLAIWILVSILNIAVWDDAVENIDRLIASQRAIMLANEYTSESLRAQAAKRGFQMTSNTEFLEPYRRATQAVNRIHNELTTLVYDRPDQLQRLQTAGNLFQQWLYDVSRYDIRARSEMPLDAVEKAHELERLMLELQDVQMRAPKNNARRSDLLAQVRLATRTLHERDALEEFRDSLRQAMEQLDRYEAAVQGDDRESAARELRGAVADYTRITQSLLDADMAIKTSVANDYGDSLLQGFYEHMNRFIAAERVLLDEHRAAMETADERGRFIFWAGPALGMLMMVIMTSWMSRRIALSLEGITRAARGLARGELQARAAVTGNDEFAVLAERFNSMAELVESRSRESAALAELGELLQSSTTIDEAAGIFADLATKLFPGQPGALYLMAPSRDEVIAVTFWHGGEQLSEPEFVPEDCWALRLSRAHQNTCENAVRCVHLTTDRHRSVCLPLHAFGETMGMLFVADPADGFPEGSIGAEQHREFIDTVAEQLALALANLRLRETLRHQSIRDPLTQLYNRRYLDETFRRELHRAARRNTPLSVLLFDIDHFKNFNDSHGHDGGDALLKAVGSSLRDFFRAEDGAFRAGGEEFVAVLPETALEDALSRAEELREEIARLEVRHGNVVLPTITISIGVAAFPEHGETTEELLKAADRALYRAKEGGRNRVMAAE